MGGESATNENYETNSRGADEFFIPACVDAVREVRFTMTLLSP